MAARSLRILQICPYFYPVWGGLEKVILQLSSAMAARGHCVTVFTSDLTHNGRLDSHTDRLGGVEIRRFPSWFRMGSFASFWPLFSLELRAREFDVVHAHSYRHPHCDLASLRVFRGGAKFVLQPHWPGHPRGFFGRGLASVYDGGLGRRLLRASDLVLALTPQEVPWLRARGARNIKIMPNGIETKLLTERSRLDFRRQNGIDEFFVLSLGRVEEMKGFQFVIKALHQVPSMRYVIAGSGGDFHRDIVRLIHNERLQDRVMLVGELSEDQVLSALDACDAYIQPSLFESFGLGTLEALARGKACAGSKVGGLSSLLDDCGLLFDAGDVPGIAACLQLLRDDHGLRQRLGAAGRLKATGLTWDRLVPLYEDMLLELTSPRSDSMTDTRAVSRAGSSTMLGS